MDQVLHPYETQHALKEVVEIFGEMGVRVVGTSINHYEKIGSLKEMYDVGMRYLNEHKYYPGYFYVLGEKE